MNNIDNQGLLKRFGIIRPPSIMFFRSDGMERKNFCVVGYMAPEKFSAHVARAFAK
ncbi:MAG TPA: hypothetical protein VET48_10200 [Steroidobacteraceae bacterium]|nr:hypothetical protein [Steroidobacteraceae bacterium]